MGGWVAPIAERNPIGGARVEVREGSVVIPVIAVTDSTQRESVVPGSSAEVVTRVDDGHCHALAHAGDLLWAENVRPWITGAPNSQPIE